ncbi:hypothetical protein B566_EDAN017896 [Ephemera danica]|nr:hypothetical protein B566_EDAN017896 [Ephemera danica]
MNLTGPLIRGTARYNCHKKCTIDELAKVASPVHCSYIKIGSLIKIHECRCKSNCLKTEVRCDENEGWVIDETPCRDFGVGRVKLEGNLTYLFQNGLYTYGCEPGFILDGNLTNRCEDGLLFGDAPKCVPVAPVIGKTADNVTTAKDFDGSTVEYISIPVTAFCIILILLTLAVIGCGVWIWKSRKSRITTPTSQVPTLLTRINIEAFADNTTDPRYV